MAVADHLRYPSPLRYPGGKGKLANFVKLLFLKNDLVGSEYVEPYAGGAAVALSLLFEDYASHVHINDLNPSIYTFWSVVLNEADELCERIRSVPLTTEEWQRQRLVQEQSRPQDIDLAFSTFFLNRTSRSGIIGGGIIGGLDQTGPWKIDARFSRNDLIRRIQKIARHRSRITVTGLDAADYLATQLPDIHDPFVYLDPPYYVKGGELYRHSYLAKDHTSIARRVTKLDMPWMVSYDTAPEILSLYQNSPSILYDLSYSAQDRYRGKEVIFFSDDLDLPDVQTPASISWQTVDDLRTSN
jgi:DNA adenine methylase